jgi:hypothetical protein
VQKGLPKSTAEKSSKNPQCKRGFQNPQLKKRSKIYSAKRTSKIHSTKIVYSLNKSLQSKKEFVP